MSEHVLQLATGPFEAIASGKKTIESRLFDEKRQMIQIGDTIIFVNRENPAQTLKVKVVDLLRYDSFAALFSAREPAEFGGESKDWLLRQIGEFYSLDDQKKYSVVGIEFVVL